MTTPWTAYLRRGLLAVAVLAAGWAVVVVATGGIVVRAGPLRLSSRDPGRILLVAAMAAAGWLLWSRRSPRVTLLDDWQWWKAKGLAAAAALQAPARLVVRHPAAAIGLLGASLHVHLWAGGLTFWVDEEMIALNVRDRPFAELGGSLWLAQSAPLGWLFVERAVFLTLGSGERAARLIPLLAGLATLAVAWWVGRRWMGRLGASVLMLLVVFGQWVSHYRFQLKHYSADTLAALLLPALAVWAAEADDPARRSRRIAAWWAAAGLGQFFANGALLVTPACAAWLLIEVARRRGRRAALTVSLWGVLWAALFAVHYATSLRHTHESRYLRTYWAAEMPPYDIGVAGMLRWLGARVQPLAIDPGGTDLAAILWLCAAAGWVLGSRRSLGAVFALMPLSAFVFAALRLVPLYQRFSLWIAPAFYVGVALLVDRLAAFTRDAWTRRLRLRLAAAAAAGLAVAALAADVVVKGGDDLFVTTPRNLHRVDDHAAVEWLLAQRQPGDALMTTRLGWPALWWYGGIPIADAEGLSRRQPDGSAMYEMRHTPHYGECSRQPLRALLQGHRRVLVYMGFPDRPDGFDHLLLEDLAALGRISAFREFTEITLAVVVDLRTPDAGARDLVELTRKWRRDRPADLDGCVTARPVRRW